MKFNPKEAIQELEYNAERTDLVLPEYGRHLHKLIDQIIKIEDKETRNKAANYVIDIMGSMNPHLRDVPDFQHKLWDQLFKMSKFKLDVDSPYPIPNADSISIKPAELAYPQNFPKYRFYGNNITYMINKALSWEPGEMRDALIIVIANHMKKSYLSWNKETVADGVIFEHLYDLSKGEIDLAKTTENLSNSSDLIRVNKKQTNKSNFSSNNNKNNTHNNNNNNGKIKRFVKPNNGQNNNNQNTRKG
ncbi:DUF4290 domain-containing protein [Paenimyroides tangerinum]|uniref:DUF4290 domain-containing protein n=1 Tax=Paenimyroides tangerinum TaxID=2488728 RepID=A0A3P3W062_9FLAO|nr:DUF4290 domain-containing protein [Paenimyroides tangerinum]RRJ88451.1 DUF4290 domain-containing protein [Paenimyroides tangerinum]